MKIQNRNQTARRSSVLLRAVALSLLLAGPALAGEPPRPPTPSDSSAYGKSFAEWQELYSRWSWGQVSVPTDANGNALGAGNVVLLSFPATPGDGTPGSVDLTLNVGQAFVLPLWNIFGTSYDDGTPTDPILDLSVFQTLDITFKIGGVTMVSTANVMDYYSAFAFDPVIPLPPEWSPYQDIVWFQGVGTVQPPLSKGQHTMTLDVKNTIPVVDGKGNSYVFEYHNTWNVTVKSRN